MLARGENVSNVSRAFGCHRNTIVGLRQRFQQTGGVANRRKPGRPRVTNPRSDRFITLTHLRRRFQTATSSASSTVSANRQCCAASGKPGNPFGQGSPMWDKSLQHVIGQNGICVRGDSSALGFYFLISLGLNLVIMMVEFEFLGEEGNVLLIIVSLKGTDLKVGVLWYGGGIMGRRKTNLIVVQGNLNAQGYINQILQPKAVCFLQRHGPAILMHDNARPQVARICRQFLNRNNVNVLPWPAVSPDMNPIEHTWDFLGRKVRDGGNVHNLRDLENTLIKEWNSIPNVVIRRYVRSMRGRLAACINSRGDQIRY